MLLALLLKWQYQPAKQSKSWQFTLRTQRKEVAFVLAAAPSLRTRFTDAAWLEIIWAKARSMAEAETGLDIDTFPEACPWAMADILDENWYPPSH